MATEIWPVYSQEAENEKSSRHHKKDRRESPWTYVSAELGCIGAATLKFDGRNAAHWTFASDGKQGNRLVVRKSCTLFTPASGIVASRKVHDRATSTYGLHFLQTRYPDVDLADMNFGKLLKKDKEELDRRSVFDPLEGSRIGSVTIHDNRQGSRTILLFSTGETDCSLALMNISASRNDVHDRVTLEPQIVKTFSTPILDISASLRTFTNNTKQACFSIRTMGGLSLHGIKSSPGGDPMLTDLGRVSRTEIGECYAVDAKFGHNDRLAVVNEKGALFDCRMEDGRMNISPIFAAPDRVRNKFWRVCPLDNSDACLYASNLTLTKIDFRAPHDRVVLYSPQGAEIFGIGSHTEENVSCAVSTNEIVWMDQRFPGRPLFGWKHSLAVDRSMSLYTTQMTSGPMTFLSSRNHSFAFVYDVAFDQPTRLNSTPYFLPTSGTGTGSNFGTIVLPVLSSDREDNCMIYQLHESRVIWASDCSTMRTATEFDLRPDSRVVPPGDLMLSQDVSFLEAKENTIVNMSSVYQDNFVRASTIPNYTTGAVVQALNTMADFWQFSDTPVEHMMTTLDVAVRSGDDPTSMSRAGFLTRTPGNSSEIYHAMVHSKVPRSEIAQKSVKNFNVSPFLDHACPEIHGDSPTVIEKLRDLEIIENGTPTSDILIKEGLRSRQQVAVDFYLSSDVYSTRPFGSSHAARLLDEQFEDDVETMSIAAGAMSLADAELPTFRFGYLQPLFRTTISRAATASGDRGAKEDDPLGVKLLLADWPAATSPETYKYTDPYAGSSDYTPGRSYQRRDVHRRDDTGDPNRTKRPPVITTQKKETPQLVTQPRTPPSLSQPSALLNHASSQPTAHLLMSSASQDVMPSTQIVPGPHGGRLGPAKKKLTKKRVGGF